MREQCVLRGGFDAELKALVCSVERVRRRSWLQASPHANASLFAVTSDVTQCGLCANNCVEPATLTPGRPRFASSGLPSMSSSLTPSTLTILCVKRLSAPISQAIPTISVKLFVHASNTVFYRPNQTAYSSSYDRKAQQYVLSKVRTADSDALGQNLERSNFGHDWLWNAFTRPSAFSCPPSSPSTPLFFL
jgi:hypothetical protein